MSNNPLIAITMGDPAGIGPEITLKAVSRLSAQTRERMVIIGSKMVLSRCPQFRRVKFNLMDLDNVSRANFAFGKIRPQNGRSALDYLDAALELWRRGRIKGIVTAPVSKEAVNLSGIKFSGHTEYLAQRTRTRSFAMMFVSNKFKIALLTRHIPISQVARNITGEKLIEVIRLTSNFLKKYYRTRAARIAICGLNPHAGEGGLLGKEEERIIKPAIARARNFIRYLYGPLPSDTLFTPQRLAKFDAIIAMYHDQGMIPVKALDFNSCVNVTLGLPFIRTSPAHGTAFDLAGKNIADSSSMLSAIKLCLRLSAE